MAIFKWLSLLAVCAGCPMTAVAMQVAGADLAVRRSGTGVFYLGSDIAWTSCDLSLSGALCHVDENNGGGPIIIGDIIFPKGLRNHADSSVKFPLQGSYKYFQACVGIAVPPGEDPMCGVTSGKATFTVVADGVQKYEVVDKASGPPTCFSVEISGTSVLDLQTWKGKTGQCDHTTWGDARVLDVDYLHTDIALASCQASGGCKYDHAWRATEVINIGGREYPKGVFAHAPSQVMISLSGNYGVFHTCFGIARYGGAECGLTMGQVTFTVKADGVQLYEGTYNASGPATCITVDVTGAMILELDGDTMGDDSCDHSAWGDAWVSDSVGSLTTATPITKSPTGVAAIGDPHLTNFRGKKLDLHRTGNVTLLRIPKPDKEAAAAPLLRVDALASQKGPNCAQSYIESLTITGKWIKARYPAGFRKYVVSSKFADPTHPRHKSSLVVGPGIKMVVTHAKTDSGIDYLNFRASNLGKAGASIGGLLGDSDESPQDGQVPAACKESSDALPPTAEIGTL